MEENTKPTETVKQEQEVDPVKARAFQEQIESEQNLPMAVFGGAVAAVIGAGIWALITVTTKYQIGWMAIGVGFLVGFGVRFLGKGVSKSFGIVGAIFALIGCLLGNLMSACGFISAEYSVSFMRVLSDSLQQPSVAIQILKAAFHPMDILFYVIAVYEGYRLSFRRITPEEMSFLVRK